MHYIDLSLWFILYSFVGWAYESALFTVTERRFVNRGFLNGPFCPIYGSGALLITLLLSHTQLSIPALFLAAVVLTTTLEYLTAVVLENLFKAKWWDYSNFPLNFQGRISLPSSAVFGIMSVIQIKLIHPSVVTATAQIPMSAKQALLAAFIVYVLVDLTMTVRGVFVLNGRLSEIQVAVNGFIGQRFKRAESITKSILSGFEDSEFYTDRIRQLFRIGHAQTRRLMRAFPKLRSLRYEAAFKKLKDRLIGDEADDQ